MRIRYSVMLTFLLALALLPSISYGQIVQGAKVNDTVINCQISTPSGTAIKTTYIATNAQGQPCVTVVPSSNNDGVTVANYIATGQTIAISATPGQIYGLSLDAGSNTANTVVWVNFYNATAANVAHGVTTPMFSIPTLSTATTYGTLTPMPWGSPVGLPFSTALSVDCTTTKAGSSGTATGCNIILLKK